MNVTDDKAVASEADEIIEEFARSGDAADLESLAANLLEDLASYDKGPAFGRAVAEELRRRAAAQRVN